MSFEVSKILLAFLVLINPLAALTIYLDATADYTRAERRAVARICAISVFIIMVIFTLTGQYILKGLGISIGAFQVAGGLLVFMIALSLINNSNKPIKPKVGIEENAALQTSNKSSIGVVPLAMPMVIGPGGISTVVIYASSSQTYIHTLSIIAASLIISIICYLTLRAGNQVSRYLGNTGMSILNRVMGLLLAAVAVEIMATGLKAIFPDLS
jgi:multiple antibiotic resistance protein